MAPPPDPPAAPRPRTDAGRQERAWVALGAVAGAVTAGYAALLGSGLVGPDAVVTLCAVMTVLASLGAGVGLLWRAGRLDGRYRHAVALLGAGVLVWSAGELLSGLRGSTDPPSPTIADVAHLAHIVITLIGFLLLPIAQRAPLQRARSVLDGLMIAGSALLVSWIFAIRPLTGGGVTGERLAVLALPVGDVALVTVLIYMVAMVKQAGEETGQLRVACLAMAAITMTDGLYAYLTVAGTHSPGSVVDVGRFAGFALMLVVALRPAGRTPYGPPGGSSRRPVGMLSPYLAVLASLAAGFVHQLLTGTNDAVADWTRSSLVLLIVGRQLLTLRENGILTRRLEARVAARTAELFTREQRYRALVQQSSDSLAVVDAGCTVVYQSDSIERIFGYTPDQLTGRWLPQLLGRRAGARLAAAIDQIVDEPYATIVVELDVQHHDGRWRPAEMTVTNLLHDPNITGFVLNTRDVSDSKELQERLVHDAYHDALTGLASRALFRERLGEAMAGGRGRDTAVLLLDLDDFKKVNDSLGHAAGDKLLIKVAARLCASVREGDMVARFGGDEFAVLIQSVVAVADAETVARRIVATLREPLLVEAREMHVGVSIGLAAAADAADMEQLMRNADLAMYRAKATGGSGFAGYDPQMLAGLVQRLELESDLRLALERGELQLHYQPTVDLSDTRIVGFEALVRWYHPERGMIPPLDFIGIAESTGLIVPLGHWVLTEACRQAVSWAAGTGQPPVRMAVNVSVRQFDHTDLAEVVAQVLAETSMPAERLCLEMTESVLMTDTEDNLMQLLRLKALGVTLAMDDFGTGYSSLAYLGRFPLDTLKIDRSFVQRLGGDSEDTALVETIVRLGGHLGMHVVAEGIEEPDQLAVLRAMGCDFGQGYLFSRPVPAVEAGRLLRDGLPAASTRQGLTVA